MKNPLQESPDPQHPRVQPLLPEVFSQPISIFWMWVLPVGVLLVLNLQGFWLIEGNMDTAERNHAIRFGIAGLVNLLLAVLTYGILHLRGAGRSRGALWGFVPLLTQIAYLWYAVAIMDSLLPESVTTWIYTQPRFLFNQFTCAMLPLFAGLIRVACIKPRARWKQDLGISVAMAAGGPFLLFCLFQVLSTFSMDGPSEIPARIFAALVVGLGVLMFIGIVRGLSLLFRRLNTWSAGVERSVILLVALVMPIGGLLLNRTIPFPVDFQAWEVYALVVANTVLMLLASYAGTTYPRASFLALCGSFPFSLYFFIVFLPFTPLSIFAVIAMGAGFLVLTPTFLFIIHLGLLRRSHSVCDTSFSKGLLVTGGILAFCLLPAFFTVRGLADKGALNAALDHVYTPNINSVAGIQYPGNRANLKRALASHRNYKNGIYYPFLSDFYSWLVFDNLVLPDDKLTRLETTFFATAGSTENSDLFNNPSRSLRGGSSVRNRSHMPVSNPPSREVEIIDQDLHLEEQPGTTTVGTLRLTLENVSNGNWGGAEFIRKLEIRPGTFITGFRLHIEGVAVPGRIFEKKTALWVYTMIRDSERRDPGLLVYNNPRELELRVFPVEKGKPATVEIDFLLPGKTAPVPPGAMPDVSSLFPSIVSPGAHLAISGDSAYLAPLNGLELPSVERQHYLHLIIDRSEKTGFTGSFQEVKSALQERFPDLHHARVTVANYDVIDLNESPVVIDDLAGMLQEALPVRGGFDVDTALSHSISRYQTDHLDACMEGAAPPSEPVFVIVSRVAEQRPLVLDRALIWKASLSRLDVHELGGNGQWYALAGEEDAPSPPLIRLGSSIRPAHDDHSLLFPVTVHNQEPRYFEPDGGTWLPIQVTQHPADSTWSHASRIWSANHRYAASPGRNGTGLGALVTSSRESGILIPATSYIVVENEAQWRMLQVKEGQKLDQNEALEFLETPAPSVWIIGSLFALWLVLSRWRGNRARTCPMS